MSKSQSDVADVVSPAVCSNNGKSPVAKCGVSSSWNS